MKIVRRFIPYYKPYLGLFFLDMLCAAIVSLVDVAFPQILNILTKTLFVEGPEVILSVIGWVALGMVVMYGLKLACEYFISTGGHIMGARMEGDMRRNLFDKMQALPYAYFDRNNSGDLMARVISDLFEISEIAHHGPENFFLSICKITGAFIVLMTINIPLTLILFGMVIVMAVFSFYLNGGMKRIFRENREMIAEINSTLLDSLSGIRVVKSFANENIEHQKFEECNQAFIASKKKAYKLMGVFQSGNGFLQGMLFAAVIVIGGLFIANHQITVTDLALYALYINVFINPVNVLINFMEMFQKGVAGFGRYLEIVDTEVEIQDKLNAKTLEHVVGEVCYEDVHFAYEPTAPVLTGFDLKIPAGKTVALVGPSGGGKTTICSLLPRFYDVNSGRITIDGQDIRDVTQDSLHQAIGVVQQDVYLFASTFRDNIAYGKPGATEAEIIEAAKNANIHDYIMSLPNGYDTHVGERGVRLSGGQKQRISIARVFLKNPKILILDEATSALDNESERYIQASLEQLSQNRTTIVIAHRLSTIQNADKIYVIDGHGTAEHGMHDQLMALDGIYARYYRMQFGDSFSR